MDRLALMASERRTDLPPTLGRLSDVLALCLDQIAANAHATADIVLADAVVC